MYGVQLSSVKRTKMSSVTNVSTYGNMLWIICKNVDSDVVTMSELLVVYLA